MIRLTEDKVAEFRKIILDYYQQQGRHTLPWRTTHTTPYHIMVAEIMSQQTTVERIIPKFLAFCTSFPTVRDLAHAEQKDVLSHWIGLGYNRRALYLHRAAQTIVADHKGHIPDTVEALLSLPGIGPYTAASIATFAYNKPEIVIDTNIRTVFIHHFFQDGEHISDSKLIPLIERTLDYVNPRGWYSALMDYGAYLKKSVGNKTRQSKHYAKQSPLRGSRRELRGAILKLLKNGPLSLTKVHSRITRNYSHNTHSVVDIVNQLVAEKIITLKDKTVSL